jgi:phosphoribosyl-AMP cyclohydrolase / phosphoribosyl-ATP pyrophosphohydrolase
MRVEIGDLKFDERGLVPAVVQDAATGEVLTLAYMSAESLRRTLESGETWFWSRSRSELWHKGATSGRTQRVVGVAADCDADALVVAVEPRGPACHTGARSCFGRGVAGLRVVARAGESGGGDSRADGQRGATGVERGAGELGATLAALYELIERRRRELPENSYTTYLFREGLDKILKKVGEESAETIIAAKNEDTARLVGEVSDLVYHLLVLLVERGVALGDVGAELVRRAGKSASVAGSERGGADEPGD